MALRSGYKGFKKLLPGLKIIRPGTLGVDNAELSKTFFTRSEQSVLGAVNLNRGDVDHTYIRGTARTYEIPFPLNFNVGDKWKISFDIEDSDNFATSNGLGCKLIAMSGEDNIDCSAAYDFGNEDGHFEHIFTVTAEGTTKPRIYFFLASAETADTATLKVTNLMISFVDADGYAAPAMTNQEITDKVVLHKVTDGITYTEGVTPNASDQANIRRIGDIKILSLYLKGIAVNAATWFTIGILSDEMKPDGFYTGYVTVNGKSDVCDLLINSNKTIQMRDNTNAVTATDIVKIVAIFT